MASARKKLSSLATVSSLLLFPAIRSLAANPPDASTNAAAYAIVHSDNNLGYITNAQGDKVAGFEPAPGNTSTILFPLDGSKAVSPKVVKFYKEAQTQIATVSAPTASSFSHAEPAQDRLQQTTAAGSGEGVIENADLRTTRSADTAVTASPKLNADFARTGIRLLDQNNQSETVWFDGAEKARVYFGPTSADGKPLPGTFGKMVYLTHQKKSIRNTLMNTRASAGGSCGGSFFGDGTVGRNEEGTIVLNTAEGVRCDTDRGPVKTQRVGAAVLAAFQAAKAADPTFQSIVAGDFDRLHVLHGDAGSVRLAAAGPGGVN